MTHRNPAWNRRTEAARKYRPNRVRLLLVAESPPADTDQYFYFENASGAGDELFQSVCQVLFEDEPGPEKVPYLKELRRRGVFVVELKPDAHRDAEPLRPYVDPFLLNIDALSPEQITLISPHVYEAAYRPMKQAGLPVADVRIPSPSGESGVEFRQKLRQALVRTDLEKLIRPLSASKRAPNGSAGAAAPEPPKSAPRSRVRRRVNGADDPAPSRTAPAPARKKRGSAAG